MSSTIAQQSSLDAAPAPAPARPAWLNPALYPFASHVHVTGEGRMHYVDEGPMDEHPMDEHPMDEPRGRPILFVHGTPSWSFEWRHAIAELRRHHRCVAPDHLGFGLSDKPRDAALTPADHARRLRGLVHALDLRDITLVVHDFGGPIGLSLALDEPERFSSVVVLNSWMWAHGAEPRIRWMSRLVASPLGRFLYSWLNASPRWIVPASFGDRSRLDRETHRHYLGPFGHRRERMGPWTLGCELARSDPWYASLWDRREVLSQRPLTLVWGMKDPAFGEDYLARWREAFPHATLVRADEAGHFPQEEAPQQVTAAIEAAARGSQSTLSS